MKRFLIYISQAYSIPIGRPLQKEIENRGYKVKWFCDEEETQISFSAKEDVLLSVKDVMKYTPDVVLTVSNVVPDFFPGIKVQIFHGFSVGKRSESKGHFNIRGFFDLYCTQGPTTTKPFKELQKKYKYFEVVETGWSKMDPMFPLEEKNVPVLATIMISSTFSTRLSLAKNPEVLKEIERLAKSAKWKFIAVLHPKMEKEVVEKFKSLENDYFTFYDTVDLIPLFRKADVMLSDTTSAITEFVLQRKPVVTINNNKPASYMINISKVDELEDALEYALTKPVDIMKHIDEFIKETHPSRDGKSSQRVIDACLNFLEHAKIKRKPLNLIRRYKIRKKLKYFKI
ncbi:MAG: CDP-glycerol glycerophosphotransferase [Epsilonproteobacteria bacterium]|nr:MAG: CDP-glycerol glycerophosphotransferase [Campylobacterota bacterium]